MSDALTGEQTAPLTLGMPLTAPSVEAAIAFLEEYLPPGILSSGSGRRRSRQLQPAGRRSDHGYLAFYRRFSLDAAPEIRALRSIESIRKHVQEQLTGPLADHWVSLQLTLFRAGRDGRPPYGGYTAAAGRHIPGIVLDLDGARMAPQYRRMLQEDPWAFKTAVEERLDLAGISMYLMLRSGPVGAQLALPLIANTGRPLRASEANLKRWELAAKGLCRLFADLGADPNAVRPTQPFVLPGLPRLKHPGFIPYVYAQRPGRRNNLIMLIRRLAELKMLHRSKAGETSLDVTSAQDIEQLLWEIREKAAGVIEGQRNVEAHRVGVMLLVKGATVEQAWDALDTWNRRNLPSLSSRELDGCLRSAERCRDRYPDKWAEMSKAPWNGLRSVLGLPRVASAGFYRHGRRRPLTPPKPWLVRKTTGGREHYEEVAERLLRLVAGEGGHLEMTQQQIADFIDSNRSTVKQVLKRLAASGRLIVATQRGRGGKTTLLLPRDISAETDSGLENGHSRISSEAAKTGVWVGRASEQENPFAAEALPGVFDGPGAVLADLCRRRLGVDLWSCRPVPVVSVLNCGARVCRLVARTELGRAFLQGLMSVGGIVELERRLGCRVELELARVAPIRPWGGPPKDEPP